MPPLQHTHTRHTPFLQLHAHTHHTGFVDRRRWSDGAAGMMERYAGWWTKSGMIGLPPQKKVKGVGRHNMTQRNGEGMLCRGSPTLWENRL